MDNHGYQEGLILRLHMMHMFACLQGEFNELLLIRANSFSRSCPRLPKDSHVQVHCAQVAWVFTSLEYSFHIWGDLREQESRFKLETCFLHVFASPSCM